MNFKDLKKTIKSFWKSKKIMGGGGIKESAFMKALVTSLGE